jgi:hypothetical protein
MEQATLSRKKIFKFTESSGENVNKTLFGEKRG